MNPHPNTNLLALLSGALLLATIAARANPVAVPPGTPQSPGILFTSPTAASGTVLADQTSTFSLASHPLTTDGAPLPVVTLCFRDATEIVPFYLRFKYFAAGAFNGPCPLDPDDPSQAPPFSLTCSLRSLVVNEGGFRTYYYQLKNTTPAPTAAGYDIFRLSIGGFDGLGVLDVSYSSGLEGVVDAGNVQVAFETGAKAPYSADRDPATPDYLSFDFDAAQFINTTVGGPSDAPGNVDAGETSMFIAVHTSRPALFDGGKGKTSEAPPSFPSAGVLISGAGTIAGTALAPVPEPTTAALTALGLLAVAGARPRRS